MIAVVRVGCEDPRDLRLLPSLRLTTTLKDFFFIGLILTDILPFHSQKLLGLVVLLQRCGPPVFGSDSLLAISPSNYT